MFEFYSLLCSFFCGVVFFYTLQGVTTLERASGESLRAVANRYVMFRRAGRIGAAAENAWIDALALAAALKLRAISIADALRANAFLERVTKVAERTGAHWYTAGVQPAGRLDAARIIGTLSVCSANKHKRNAETG